MTTALKDVRELLARLNAYTAAYDLADDVRPVLTALCEALEEANQMLRSTWQIAERDGATTNWGAFKARLHKVLESEHRLMYPHMYPRQLQAGVVVKIFQCSECGDWIPDWRAYRYDGRLYCDEDLPSAGWDVRLHPEDSPENAS